MSDYIYSSMAKTVIVQGAKYYIEGLGWVRFIKDESKGQCRVLFNGIPIHVNRYELRLAA